MPMPSSTCNQCCICGSRDNLRYYTYFEEFLCSTGCLSLLKRCNTEPKEDESDNDSSN